MAVTMKKEDQDALAAAGAKWNAATTQAEKDAAHAEAESIRAKYNYSGGSDGSQYIPTSTSKPSQDIKPAGGQYVAVDPTGVDNYHAKNTANNGMGMSASDLALLESYGQAYNNATNDAERQAAHAAAEALRAQYGYSGGGDGSEYIAGTKPVVQAPTFGDFSYSDAPTHTDPYAERIDAMLNQILNRDKFSYNALEDDLFLQYKDQYTREGERAMKDTLGQVAARTGGLASSYAVSAAQQQNNYYMQQLSDKIPELYQLAYQMYLDDIDLQVQDLGLLQGASDTAYNRYRDTMSDWRDDRDFAYGMFRDDIGDQKWSTELNYGAIRDVIGDSQWQMNYDRGVFESDRNYDYTKEQDTNNTAYDRALELLSAGVMPESSMLSAAGLTNAQASALLETAKAKGGSGGGSGGGGGYKPKLSASAVLDALESGIVNDETTQAYKYYYGQDWNGEPEPEPEPQPEPEPDSNTVTDPADDEVGNNHGDSWVYVPGYGRLSWQELESYVDKGKIKEAKDEGKFWYTKVN